MKWNMAMMKHDIPNKFFSGIEMNNSRPRINKWHGHDGLQYLLLCIESFCMMNSCRPTTTGVDL